MFNLSGTRARAIEVLRSWAEAEPLVRNVILFGSYVTGKATTDSDLDVAVGLNAPTYDDEALLFIRRRSEWKEALGARLGSGSPPIDLVSYDVNATGENETGSILREARRLVVYGDDPFQGAEPSDRT
jgi:predicted nucleotidyltransferase